MADKENPSLDSHESGPLHRPPSRIDAGKTNDGNEGAIVKPSEDMHTTKPTPGNEVPGQVAKM